ARRVRDEEKGAGDLARAARGQRLRIRVSAGEHESQAAAQYRNRVHDDGRRLFLCLVEPGARGRVAGRKCRRARAAERAREAQGEVQEGMSAMQLSKRVKAIKPSPTLALNAKAKALAAKGVDVVSFAAGEPDFDTPKFIKDAAIAALNAGFTKYTATGGIPE